MWKIGHTSAIDFIKPVRCNKTIVIKLFMLFLQNCWLKLLIH